MSCNGGSHPRINTLGRMTRAESGPDLRYEMTCGGVGGGGGGGGGGGTSRMYYSRRCTVTDQNSDGYGWVPGRGRHPPLVPWDREGSLTDGETQVPKWDGRSVRGPARIPRSRWGLIRVSRARRADRGGRVRQGEGAAPTRPRPAGEGAGGARGSRLPPGTILCAASR